MSALAFDPGRRDERFERQLEATQRGWSFGDLRSRLRQAEAFADGDDAKVAPQDPREIMADVLSLLRYLGVAW